MATRKRKARSTSAESIDAPPSRLERSWIAAPIIFAVLTLLMFGDLLISDERVVSAPNTDTAIQFLPWRQFGFEKMVGGDLPLWNPHIFGGAPYFAGFQSALLYPPNWLHLIMPVALAINWIVALHVFLAGWFTYLWCRGRNIGWWGSLLAGVLFMFSGPYFYHIYAGHLPHNAVMVWAPLLLLVVDRLVEKPTLRWTLLGMAIVAMQILAGHPQYVYYTAIAVGIYALLHLKLADNWRKLLGGVAAMYLGGALLAAIQLLAGIEAAGEYVRSGGLPFEMAKTFSLHPEYWLTFIAPFFFGDHYVADFEYANIPSLFYGRGYLWELCLFIGVSGWVLSIYGLTKLERGRRWIIVTMLIVLFVLASGAYMPIYTLLYKYLPFYGSFRVTAKFSYLAILILCMTAGVGLERLRSLRQGSREFVILALSTGTLALVLLVIGLAIRISSEQPGGWWARQVATYADTTEHMVTNNPQLLRHPQFVAWLGNYSSGHLLLGGATMLAVGAIVLSARKWPHAPSLLLALAAIEVFVFAYHTRDAFPPRELVDFARKKYPSNAKARVLHEDALLQNWAMVTGHSQIWGADPGVQKRYAQLLWSFFGANPDEATQYLPPMQSMPTATAIFSMLRWEWVVLRDPRVPFLRISDLPDWQARSIAAPRPLEKVQLAGEVRVIPERDEIFRALKDPGFNPRQTVIVESSITPAPTGNLEGASVSLVRDDGDEMEITATLTEPAVLLITDAYSKGWQTRELNDNPQAYQVIPANYALRAIPLAAGEHHLLLEYRPAGFVWGRIVTCIALIGYANAWTWLALRRRADEPVQ
jgi:hypothetical protein